MTADANPKSLQVGDPITVTARISGRGNFDRVTAPALEDDHGWHKYPPSADFKQDDDVGISGAKTFETVISPNETKQRFRRSAFHLLRSGERTIRDSAQRSDSGSRGGRRRQLATPAPAMTAPRRTAPPLQSRMLRKQQDILYQLTRSQPRRSRLRHSMRAGHFGWPSSSPAGSARVYGLENSTSTARRTVKRNDARPCSMKQRSCNEACGATTLRRRNIFHRLHARFRLKTALVTRTSIQTRSMRKSQLRLLSSGREHARPVRRLFEKSDEVRYSGAAERYSHGATGEREPKCSDLIESLRMKQRDLMIHGSLRSSGANRRALRSAFAESDAQFAKANQDYSEGQFPRGRRRLQELVQSGAMERKFVLQSGQRLVSLSAISARPS